jgi:hypothetical protein
VQWVCGFFIGSLEFSAPAKKMGGSGQNFMSIYWF